MLYSSNYHNIINQLYFNKKIKDTWILMFIVVLFAIAKKRKQPKALIYEWIKKIQCVFTHTHTHTHTHRNITQP